MYVLLLLRFGRTTSENAKCSAMAVRILGRVSGCLADTGRRAWERKPDVFERRGFSGARECVLTNAEFE